MKGPVSGSMLLFWSVTHQNEDLIAHRAVLNHGPQSAPGVTRYCVMSTSSPKTLLYFPYKVKVAYMGLLVYGPQI